MGNAVTMQASTSPLLRGGQRDGAHTPRPLTAREERDTRDALDAPSPPSQPLVRHTPTPQPPTTRPPRQDTTAQDDDNNNKEDNAVAATQHPRLQMLERVAHEEHACSDTTSKATTSAAAAAVEACERATSPRCRTPPPPRHAVGAAAVADAMAAYRGACTRSASPAAALGAYTALPLSVVRATLQRSHAVYRVCLTGGPCAGKSTMLAYVQTQLPRRTGCRVLCVPEAATMLVTAGMQWDAALRIEQQATVLRTQLALEDTLYALACATAVPTVVLSDRGTMDGRAFCSDDEFAEVLRRVGCSADVLRDRYDAVVHLITAACGAEAYYTLDNNGARYEDVDGARASDAKLRQVYVGHPNLHLIDNATSFAAKMERGLRVILRLLQKDDVDNNNDNNSDDDDAGESGSSSREQQNNKDDTSRVKNTDDDADGAASTTWQRTCSYYLVRHCPDVLPTTSAAYDVTTTILCNSQLDDVRLLVRRTTDTGSAMHFFVSVRQAAAATVDAAAAAAAAATSATQQRVERVQRISSKEYASLLRHRDMTCADVVVRARHFLYEHASCELSTFVAPPWVRGKQTLLIEYETARGDASSNSNNDDNKDNDNNDNDKDNAAAAAAATATSSSSCAVPLPDYVVVDREVPLERTTATFLIAHTQTGPLYTSLVFAPVFSRGVRRRTGSGGGGGGGPHVDVEDVASSTCSMSRQPSSLLQQQQQQLLMLGASRDVVSATTATATATATTTRPRTPPTRRDAADKVNGSHADTSSATVMTPLRVRDVNTTATRAKTTHDDEAAVAEQQQQQQQQHGSSTHSDVPVLPRIVPPTTTATVVAAVDADTAASRQRERRHRRTRQHTDKAPAAQMTTVTPPRPPPLPLPSSSSRPLSPPPRERVAALSLHLHEDKENVPTTA